MNELHNLGSTSGPLEIQQQINPTPIFFKVEVPIADKYPITNL